MLILSPEITHILSVLPLYNSTWLSIVKGNKVTADPAWTPWTNFYYTIIDHYCVANWDVAQEMDRNLLTTKQQPSVA